MSRFEIANFFNKVWRVSQRKQVYFSCSINSEVNINKFISDVKAVDNVMLNKSQGISYCISIAQEIYKELNDQGANNDDKEILNLSLIRWKSEDINFGLSEAASEIERRKVVSRKRSKYYYAGIEKSNEASRVLNHPSQEPIGRPEIIEDDDYSHELEPELDD